MLDEVVRGIEAPGGALSHANALFAVRPAPPSSSSTMSTVCTELPLPNRMRDLTSCLPLAAWAGTGELSLFLSCLLLLLPLPDPSLLIFAIRSMKRCPFLAFLPFLTTSLSGLLQLA